MDSTRFNKTILTATRIAANITASIIFALARRFIDEIIAQFTTYVANLRAGIRPPTMASPAHTNSSAHETPSSPPNRELTRTPRPFESSSLPSESACESDYATCRNCGSETHRRDTVGLGNGPRIVLRGSSTYIDGPVHGQTYHEIHREFHQGLGGSIVINHGGESILMFFCFMVAILGGVVCVLVWELLLARGGFY
ncbi:hypothetical protein GGS26DRAFT_590967 [Hypomontagnella submonticulosa]|nr:hypothetical protein GGS26DRAFT_590967 [Hypomontagnella submonticulosa]